MVTCYVNREIKMNVDNKIKNLCEITTNIKWDVEFDRKY